MSILFGGIITYQNTYILAITRLQSDEQPQGRYVKVILRL
jgi:hypothetical protein